TYRSSWLYIVVSPSSLGRLRHHASSSSRSICCSVTASPRGSGCLGSPWSRPRRAIPRPTGRPGLHRRPCGRNALPARRVLHVRRLGGHGRHARRASGTRRHGDHPPSAPGTRLRSREARPRTGQGRSPHARPRRSARTVHRSSSCPVSCLVLGGADRRFVVVVASPAVVCITGAAGCAVVVAGSSNLAHPPPREHFGLRVSADTGEETV